MRAVLSAFLVALVVAMASAAELKTVFEIPLQYPVTTFEQGQMIGFGASVIGGNRVYSITSGQMGVEAADFTTKSAVFAVNTSQSIGSVISIVGTDSGVVAVGNTGIEAFDATGKKLLTSTKYFSTEAKTNSILNGTNVGIIVQSMTYSYLLIAVDFTTGMITESFPALSVFQAGSTAYILAPSQTSESTTLIAFDVATNATLWTKSWGTAGGILAASSKYIFGSSSSGNGDTMGLALDPATGKVLRSLDALNGLNADCVPPKIDGDLITLVVGEEYQRLVIFNLTNGYQIFARTIGDEGGCGNGGGAVVTGGGIVTINNNNLELSITSLSTGAVTTVKGVPSNPSGTVTAFAAGIVAAGNLQGYTLWDSKTGAYIGRNEKSPGAGAASPLMWGKYYVSVAGNVVVVQEFVQ